MTAKRTAAASTSDAAAHAAEAALASGSTAVEAALTGWLALGGATSWALFAPVTVAVGGGGEGAAFVDGRARQPGKGLVRPLRYASDPDVPTIARVSVPATGAVLAAAAALFGARSSQVTAAGLKAAKRAGATARARMLSHLATAPQRALTEPEFADALLTAAPRIRGAMIGGEDLSEVLVEVCHTPTRATIAGRAVASPPWSDPMATRGRTDAVVAVDRQGSVAAVVIDAALETFSLFDGELELPLAAAGVRKGVPRVRPAAALPSPASVALVTDADGSTHAIAGLDAPVGERLLTALLPGPAAARAVLGGVVSGTRSAYARASDAPA